MGRPTKPTSNCGHVFLLHCDAKQLAADVVLIPGNPGPDSGVRKTKSEDSWVTVFEAANVRGIKDSEKLLECEVQIVKDYLNAATAAVGDSESKLRRTKSLLALPLIGVGQMDPDDVMKEEGKAVSTVLPLLYKHANTHGMDIALCTTDEQAYGVMQVFRDELCPLKGGPFWMMPKKMQKHAEIVADKAIKGALSIFFGAGVSYSSGLPSWGDLLGGLAVEAGFSEEEQRALKELDYLDQPTLIEERMGRGFREAVADATKGGRFAPMHAILAELRLPAATTNYDDLYEEAAASTSDGDRVVLRLPWASAEVSTLGSRETRALTKLHGCVSKPKDIVLTREDYMRYEDSRRALRGVVQQMLLTSDVMFVGFSMTDTNLHKIIDEVREATHRMNREKRVDKLGIITALCENEMFRLLWDQDFHVYSFGKSWDDNPAWMHDCFFDCFASIVASRKAKCTFILNPKYKSLLSEEDKKIADALKPLVEIGDDPAVQGSLAWSSVQKLLHFLGSPQ